MKGTEEQEDRFVLRRQEGAVAWITLNRPDRLNALAADMRAELHRALLDAIRGPESRAIVITGTGRAFCAGADIDAMRQLLEDRDEEQFRALIEAGSRVVREIYASPKPVIAAVNGVAAGAGASLALACDIRIASASASIGLTFTRVGLHPDWGATFFLPQIVGRGRAAELIFSGRILDAAEAERVGIFEQVVADEQFPETVTRTAHAFANGPPLALAAAKANLQCAFERPLDECTEAETTAQLRCFASGDAREGVAAFRETRSPRFTGE